jgi:hypothetical protein
LPEDDEDAFEDDYDDEDEEDEDEDELYSDEEYEDEDARAARADFFAFGNSLTVKGWSHKTCYCLHENGHSANLLLAQTVFLLWLMIYSKMMVNTSLI